LNGLGYEYGALNEGGRFGFIGGGADQNIGSGNLGGLDDGNLKVGWIREDGGARSRNEIGGDERNPHRRGHRHKDKICSACCVERGEDGDVFCVGCVEEEEEWS